MNVPVKQQVSLQQIKEHLEKSMPTYTYSFRGSSILIVKKSSTAAALVMSRSNKIIVNEGFPTMGGQLLFVLTMLLLGILIPIIIYFAAFFPAQKAVRNEVAESLRLQFGQ
jgi:hypothetical protein